MPQSQAAADPKHEEKEETDVTKQAQIEHTHEKHQEDLSLPQARQPQSLSRALCHLCCVTMAFLEPPHFLCYTYLHNFLNFVQSTLVISNSKGLSEILRDIRTSIYQICRIEENIIRTTTFNKYICNWTLGVTDILKILWKRGEIVPFYLLLEFHV